MNDDNIQTKASSADDTGPRVLYEKHGHVAYITLNRPHQLNAMDIRMHEELARIWNAFEEDPSVWVGVLTGAGERSFSVGQDLKELDARTRAGSGPSTFGSRGRPGWPRLTERHNLTKPIIARVNGLALGGGFELALACDIIIAAEHADFALPEAKLGLIAGAGGVFRLPRQIPLKIAMGYLMTGRRISAERAYQLGLVNEVASAEDLNACVERWASDILSCSPLAVRAVKQVVLRSLHLPLEEAFAARYEAEEVRRNSNDCREGPRAFVKKRNPDWSGT
jgi:dehydration protein DpgD